MQSSHNPTTDNAAALPPLPAVTTGIYLHYKQLRYQVLGCVRHSETLEPMVLYRGLYGEMALWVRPYAMFHEQVAYQGKQVPRFEWISPAQDI